jgi:hypothetical protein
VAVDFQKKAVVPEQVLFRELEGESVLLNIKTETYFGLDDVGTRMWHALTEHDSIQSAYETLMEEFDVEPDPLHSDLTELLENLRQHQLIEMINAG